MSQTTPTPEAARSAWDEQVRGELAKAGVDFESLLRNTLAGERLQPLYGLDDLPDGADGCEPGAFPFVRGSRGDFIPAGLPWAALHRTERPNPSQARTELLEDLAGGLNGLWLRTSRGLRTGADDDHGGGVQLAGPADLRQLLDGVFLDGIEVFLEAGASTVTIFEDLLSLAAERGHDIGSLQLHAGFDPFGSLLDDGTLRGFGDSLDRIDWQPIADRAGRTAGRVATVSSLAVHRAGADAALELGYLLSAGLETVRGLVAAGLPARDAAAQVTFRVPLDRELFGELAKLRALRGLWSRALLALGVEAPPAPHVQVISGDRTLSACDVWTNLLRVSGHAFAGILGGADAIYLARFDQVVGPSSPLGRRAARNLHHLFAEESHLGEVLDPAGGSYYVEARTEGLAELGWQQFSELASGKGLLEAISSGSLAERIEASRARRANAVAHRDLVLLGTSQFAQVDGRPHEPGPADEPLPKGSSGSAYVPAANADEIRVTALPERRDAEPFEVLRAQADQADHPEVFLACLGRLRDHTGRAGFARQLLAAGGLRTKAGEGTRAPSENQGAADVAAIVEQWAAAGRSPVVCVCGTNEALDSIGTELPQALRAAGAQFLLVARPPGAATQAYDQALHLGVDVVRALQVTLEAAGAPAEVTNR